MKLAMRVILAAAVASAACDAARATDPPSVLWTVQTSDSNPPTVAPAPNGGTYVTTTKSGGSIGVLTRYSNTGAEIWRNEQGGFGDQWRSQNVGSDGFGNAYIAGYHNQDVFLQKFSTDGSLIWSQQFGTPQSDWPAGLAISPNGTSFVTSGGWASNYGIPPPNSHTTVRQYLPDGSPGWVTELNTGDGTYPGATPAGSKGTAIDQDGSIINSFTNYTRVGNSISFRSYLAKTDAEGAVQWIKSVPGGSTQRGVATDASNDIFLADGLLYKYDQFGNLDWVKDNQSGGVFFGVNAVCVGPDGTVYAAGGASGDHGFIIAFDADGSELWQKSIAPPAGTSDLRFLGIAISGDELIASGQLISPIPGNPNAGAWSGNLIVALSIPEPPTIALAIMATLAVVYSRIRPNRLAS
jgi:hypothetical protein